MINVGYVDEVKPFNIKNGGSLMKKVMLLVVLLICVVAFNVNAEKWKLYDNTSEAISYYDVDSVSEESAGRSFVSLDKLKKNSSTFKKLKISYGPKIESMKYMYITNCDTYRSRIIKLELWSDSKVLETAYSNKIFIPTEGGTLYKAIEEVCKIKLPEKEKVVYKKSAEVLQMERDFDENPMNKH